MNIEIEVHQPTEYSLMSRLHGLVQTGLALALLVAKAKHFWVPGG